MFDNEALIIPLAGIILPLVLVPMVMTLKFRMKKREWEHLERMRALQMGVVPTQAGHRIGPGVLIRMVLVCQTAVLPGRRWAEKVRQ